RVSTSSILSPPCLTTSRITTRRLCRENRPKASTTTTSIRPNPGRSVSACSTPSSHAQALIGLMNCRFREIERHRRAPAGFEPTTPWFVVLCRQVCREYRVRSERQDYHRIRYRDRHVPFSP